MYVQSDNLFSKSTLYNVRSSIALDDKVSINVPPTFNGWGILYNDEVNRYIPELAREQLYKILAAVKVDPEQTLISNIAFSGLSLFELSDKIGAKKLILFGTEWIDTLHNTHLSKNKIHHLFGMMILATAPLDVIMGSDDEKKAFWKELKKLVD